MRAAGGLSVSLAVALFLAVGRIGPVLIPVALVAASSAARRRRRRGRARRVRRLTAWALLVPNGPTEAAALEPAIAADLAATAGGDLRPFRAARAVVRLSVQDAWRRELALERLARAETITADHVGGRTSSAPLDKSWFWTSTAVLVLGLVLPLPSSLPILTVTAGTLGAVLAWAELRDASAYVPQELASTALLPAAPTRFVFSEPAVVEALVELAGRELAIVDSAVAFLASMERGERTDRAHARVRAARTVLRPRVPLDPRAMST